MTPLLAAVPSPETPWLPMSMLLLLPAETPMAAFSPMAILSFPAVLVYSAAAPMAVLPVPVVLASIAK